MGKRFKSQAQLKANQLGIGMVHQHFMLVDAFTVTENIILGSEPSRMGIVDRKKAREEIQKYQNNMDCQLIQMLTFVIFLLEWNNVSRF